MPKAAHLARTQEQVVATLVRVQEAEAVGMADHAPVNQVLVIDHAIAAATVADHLAIARHGIQPARQCVLLLRFHQLQRLGQIIELQRRPVVLHHIEDELATGYGIFVFLGLAGLVRITTATGSTAFLFGHWGRFSVTA